VNTATLAYLPAPYRHEDGSVDPYLRHLSPRGVTCTLTRPLAFVNPADARGVVYLPPDTEIRAVVGDPAELRAAEEEFKVTGSYDDNPARCDLEAFRGGAWVPGYCFGEPVFTLPDDWFLSAEALGL